MSRPTPPGILAPSACQVPDLEPLRKIKRGLVPGARFPDRGAARLLLGSPAKRTIFRRRYETAQIARQERTLIERPCAQPKFGGCLPAPDNLVFSKVGSDIVDQWREPQIIAYNHFDP
jgi:hypothetical protein